LKAGSGVENGCNNFDDSGSFAPMTSSSEFLQHSSVGSDSNSFGNKDEYNVDYDQLQSVFDICVSKMNPSSAKMKVSALTHKQRV
jgi:hypothetical protein